MKKSNILNLILLALALYFINTNLLFAESHSAEKLLAVQESLSSSWGYISLFIFIIAYAFVPFKHFLHLKKSKPVLLAAGIIWLLAGLAFTEEGHGKLVNSAINHALLEYGELFLFILVAMTYINSLEERNVFQVLRTRLVSRGYSLKKIFWLTGLIAFFMSPVADNLTTALIMGTVIIAVGGNNSRFISVACINVVVAANAGGAFSPFGDITTLMVWQKGKLDFFEFFQIFIPSIINWLVPALFMSFSIGKDKPQEITTFASLKYGARVMLFLFFLTIFTAVVFQAYLNLVPAAGMMLGLGYLGILYYIIKRKEGRSLNFDGILGVITSEIRPNLRIHSGDEQSLEQLVNNNKSAALAINRNHQVTHWNEELENLTSIGRDEVVGTNKQWMPFYLEERPILADLVLKPELFDQYKGRYAGGIQVNDTEESYSSVQFFPNLGASGKWLAFTAIPVKNIENECTGVVEFIKEVDDGHKEKFSLDLMKSISAAEWDTLLFFYGVILCVSGLSVFGLLDNLSHTIYGKFGYTIANSLVGVISSVLDNIPVMLAVLKMNPTMDNSQWLLVTLTAGVGGSMLAVGSAAGVALLGTARGHYTFASHLRWTPVILLGYVLSILAHIFLNS